MNMKPEMQKEIQSVQDKQLKRTMKLLSGSDKRALTAYLQSGERPGGKVYKGLKPGVQRGILKMNLVSVDVMIKHARNPFSRFRFKLAKTTYEKMLKATA